MHTDEMPSPCRNLGPNRRAHAENLPSSRQSDRQIDGISVAFSSCVMLDRQKVEAILTNRFPGAAVAQRAAAANAIMSLTDGRDAAHRMPPAADEAERIGETVRTSTTVSVSTEIQAPLRRVFDLFTDVEHASHCVSCIKRIEMLTTDRFGVGTRWRETREILGREDSAVMAVTAFERYRRYTVSHVKAGIRIETVFFFEATDSGGTRVAIEFTLDGAGFPPGLLTPLGWVIAGKVRHVLNRDLTELRRCLESPTA
jgi:uncharacterized membrane protein